MLLCLAHNCGNRRIHIGSEESLPLICVLDLQKGAVYTASHFYQQLIHAQFIGGIPSDTLGFPKATQQN